MAIWEEGPDDLRIPFIFVPHGAPEPTEWMAAHPGWVKFPATFVPRDPEPSDIVAEPVVAHTAVGEAAAETMGEVAEDTLAAVRALGAAVTPVAAPLAAPLAALGVMLWPSHTAPPELDEEYPGGRSFAPVGPLPPLPGRAPPVPLDPRPGEGGFTALSPPRPQPGFDQTPPLPNVLPGQPVEEQGPTILHQDRNEGLSGGARTRSERARKAAREADPEVTQALPDAEWEAHHLINLRGVRLVPDVINGAAQAGWRTDDSGNVAALPASPEAQERLQRKGIRRPVHDNGHPNWNDKVEEGLWAIRRRLSRQRLEQGTEAYARAARRDLEKLQSRLRSQMLKLHRLTENDSHETTDSA